VFIPLFFIAINGCCIERDLKRAHFKLWSDRFTLIGWVLKLIWRILIVLRFFPYTSHFFPMHFVKTPANSKTRSKQCKNVVSLLIDLPRKSKKKCRSFRYYAKWIYVGLIEKTTWKFNASLMHTCKILFIHSMAIFNWRRKPLFCGSWWFLHWTWPKRAY
jgi:hypothetical protein